VTDDLASDDFASYRGHLHRLCLEAARGAQVRLESRWRYAGLHAEDDDDVRVRSRRVEPPVRVVLVLLACEPKTRTPLLGKKTGEENLISANVFHVPVSWGVVMKELGLRMTLLALQ
jgi:hypothetical protein